MKSYCDFVLKNIKKKDLFAWLDIEPNRYWDNLLFLDQANFGGKIAGSSNNSETSSSRNKIISNWNIAEYLPETIQQHFLLIVSDFILNLSKTTDNTSSSKTDIDLFGAFKENHNPNAFSSAMDIGVSNNNVINSNFTQKLFHIIQDIQRYLRTQTSNDSKNIPLEFVKTICKVLSLDKTLDDEVFKLKKSLLKLINVREFSKESEFTNPCSSFILCDEICTFCNASRDMDFLRDPNLLHGKWNCIFCDHPFNKAAIEAKLVEIVQKKSLSYQQQDLICEKCKQVKAENMLDTCSSCYGKFKCKLSTEEFTQILHTFQNIAQTHKFKWLEETISTMLFFHLPKFNV